MRGQLMKPKAKRVWFFSLCLAYSHLEDFIA